ncbi:MAG: class F sortase [Austwickia sp.]|nr:class F sortase [Actinomycetota bacterium]MCB1254933.1 class F sortase [Austwickia sp.]MCO5309373.1 class F sortase [Austwickia sp.]
MTRRTTPGRAASLWVGALTVLALGVLPACGSPTVASSATPGVVAGATGATPTGASPTVLPAAASSGESAAGITPVRVRIGALGVDAPVSAHGLNPDGTVEVPPLDRIGDVYWYDGSVRPGQAGRSVLLGHVDGRGKPGVFAALHTARPGTRVSVSDAGGRTVHYRITGIATHLKSQFPTQRVYGDATETELILVTCGGTFDRAAQSYDSNIIAFATVESPAAAGTDAGAR